MKVVQCSDKRLLWMKMEINKLLMSGAHKSLTRKAIMEVRSIKIKIALIKRFRAQSAEHTKMKTSRRT